jgi:hypothetical protein
VIQHLGEPDRYRLIVYGDAAVYRPLEFTSREATLSALRHLVPGIDENVIPAQNKTVNSGIVFTAEIEVGESQLQGAGLTRS